MNKIVFFIKKYLTLKNVLIFVLSILIVLSFFSGRFYNKKYFQNEINKKDSLINVSRLRQDSLLQLSISSEAKAKQYDEIINSLEYENTTLYNAIQNYKNKLRVRDTSFISNSKRITDSVSRFYKRNNGIR